MENRHLEILCSILSKYPYKFYTYGSHTKGTARKLSDLDLCYYEEIPWGTFSHLKEDLVYWEWMSPEFQEMIKGDLVSVT